MEEGSSDCCGLTLEWHEPAASEILMDGLGLCAHWHHLIVPEGLARGVVLGMLLESFVSLMTEKYGVRKVNQSYDEIEHSSWLTTRDLVIILHPKSQSNYSPMASTQTIKVCRVQMSMKLRVISWLNSLQLMQRRKPSSIMKKIEKTQPASSAKREIMKRPPARSWRQRRAFAIQGVGGFSCLTQSRHIELYNQRLIQSFLSDFMPSILINVNTFPSQLSNLPLTFLAIIFSNETKSESIYIQIQRCIVFEQKKRQMIPQNQLSIRHSQTHARLLYTAPCNSLETDNQLLQLYLKELTFQGSVDGPPELSNEEVEELKRIFSLLFDKYQMGLLSLSEIEGLWPFMHFAFPNISGIQLYLYFEYLLTPAPFEPARQPGVKEEYVSFNPQKYFQESMWKDNKKFMRSIRVLERTLKKKTIDDNIEACQNALSLVVMNGEQFLLAAKQFKTKFLAFKQKLKGVSVLTVMNLDQLFNERLIEEKCIESEPDFIHIIHSFTKEEYFQQRITKTKTMIEMAPIKEEEQAQNPLQQNQEEFYEETISARGNRRHAQSQMRSLPTKRRLETEKTTLKRREVKRTPRKKVIQALFKNRQKQNIIVKDLIQNRRVKERKAKEARRLEKIKKRICYSDDEEENSVRRKKRTKRLSHPKMQIQSQYESRYSHSNHNEQEYFSDDSEDIQMKRNRNIYRKQGVLNEIQNNFEHSNRNDWKKSSEEQMMVIQEPLIQTKLDRYGIGKIKESQSRVVRSQQKLQNIYIKKIRLEQDGHMPITFNFAEYIKYLQVLIGNEIEKQVKTIAKEVVARMDIQYDVNLALKIMAAWVVGKRNASTFWINAVNNYIEPLLKFTIGTNFYRTVSNVLNDFFACNDDLTALNKAKIYFNILFQVGKSYAQKGLEVIIMEIIYPFMITPKKYNTMATLQYFYPQCSAVFLSHPFKIADSELKINLEPTEASIAFSIGCLAFEALLIWRVADQSDVFKTQQKTFFDTFKNDLKGFDSNWPFHTLSKSLKSFYTIYQPSLTFDYFIRLVGIISLSLQKIIQSTFAQTSMDPKQHVQFLLEVIDKYIQTELSHPTIPAVKNLLSKLIMQTKLKQDFGNKKGNKYCTMLYASVLDLIIRKPFFRKNYSQVRGDFVKYVNQLKSQLPEIVSSLKSNIYQPIFSLISQIYEIQIEKQLKMGNDADKRYEETRNVITYLWDCLDKEYSKQSLRLNDHLSSKVASRYSQSQRLSQTKKIKEQFKKCEDLFQLFLVYFVPINDQSNLGPSTSHYTFVLELILKQHFFLKYFQNKICNNGQGNLTQKFVEVLNVYLHTSIHNQKRHLQMFSEHSNPMKKDVQHKILRETNDQTILDVFSTINWVYMVAAIEKFRTRQLSPPENTILKMISDSVGPVSTNYNNIAKATNLYNLYLRKLMIYICQREDFVMKKQMQEAELTKMKGFVWNHLTCSGKLKQMVLLIVLSSATRNCFEYERLPWSDLLYSIKKLNLLSQKNLKTNKDIGYLAFLYNIQHLDNYNSIADIFSNILNYRSNLNKEESQSLKKGIEAMLLDVFTVLKKLQNNQRDKEPITLLCLQILSFLLQWPQILPQCIHKFWKDMQVISNAEPMIAKLKMNDRNIEILLRFFDVLDRMKENPYKIKGTMATFVEKMAVCDNNIRKEQFFKRVRKILIATRECCKRDINLQRIAYNFLRDFLNRFCAPQKLDSDYYSTWMQRLQIYLEMMRDSVYERKAYEQLLIENRKKYQQMISKNKGFKVQYHNQQEQYLTLQQLIMTCMIHRHSDLYDIKRLLGAMKKQALLKQQTKEVYRALFGKLKTFAQQTIKEDIVEWTNDQLKDLQQMGNLQDWMDLQSD